MLEAISEPVVLFLSTPSARRATGVIPMSARIVFIISIHALREEGDGFWAISTKPTLYFYPRPPRGGRQLEDCAECTWARISIHALREEGDFRT